MKCLVLFLIFLPVAVYSQTLDEAKKLYAEGNYANALPAFESACKSSPKNASYNQWYGNCLLETGNRQAAAKYLNYAASKEIIEAYRSLGKLHYLNYDFEASAQAYETYLQLLEKNKKTTGTEDINQLLDRSKRAARLISHCENIQIIDSVIVDKKDFLKTYLISREAGRLEYADNRTTYINPLNDKRYFAEKNTSGYYRLYTEIKIQEAWSERKPLTLPSDSAGNDNYPFVLQDGLTVYYASTGNGSIGGYDLFVTRYNSGNDTYLAPSQMGMPFNSIANDYLMVIDENNAIGYFATDRFQAEGRVVVYTFIPNEAITPIESDDKAEQISRAKITAIRDTWKKDMNYSAYIHNVRTNIKNEQTKVKRDFFFVVNDNIIYYTLNDFKNTAAKQAFLKAQNLEQEAKKAETDLENLRRNYLTGNAQSRKSLQETILRREQQLPEQWVACNEAMTNARNLEIRYLRQQQQ
ncbi:MAG: tetratricopeptide repeat protein [Dysgonamonadaceae bacterium]|jgi:hypothetical protein|nr:tetratricopeptide repeat protein [Dysgonamonadaceae bacterium]